MNLLKKTQREFVAVLKTRASRSPEEWFSSDEVLGLLELIGALNAEAEHRGKQIEALLAALIRQQSYRDALRDIAQWYGRNAYNEWTVAGDADVGIYGPGQELEEALSSAGYEIDSDGALVVDGVRKS